MTGSEAGFPEEIFHHARCSGNSRLAVSRVMAGACRAFPAELWFMLADDRVYLAARLDQA